jgi:uncharacterized hydrophobic protein (TIGR00271 family)
MATVDPTPEKREGLSRVWDDILKFVADLTDLKTGMDPEGTIIEIKSNKQMKGANAWLLMSSIMIASLGLNMDSEAVIIGAMLISPLMSPILGVGLAVGINDRDTLSISLWNFLIAIVIALVTSYLYFKLTPLSGDPTLQILKRTQPSLLDALVGIFGGLAGIISTSRKDKSNAIPGVAIATALMPPLCVSGYGLAHGSWSIFLSSFYLFFLNSFFIALSTFVIVRFLKFPIRKYQTGKERRRTTLFVLVFSILITIPSAYILYNLWEENDIRRRVELFMETAIGDKRILVDDHQLITSEEGNKLILKVYGNWINSDNISEYEDMLKTSGVENTTIEIISTADVPLAKIRQLESRVEGMDDAIKNYEIIKHAQTAKDSLIESLQFAIDSIRGDTLPLSQVFREVRINHPDISRIMFGKSYVTDFDKQSELPLLTIHWKKSKPTTSRRREEKQLQEFLLLRTGLDTLVIQSQ